MKLNGYQIREAVKRACLQRDSASQQFRDALFAFESDEKTSPDAVMADFEKADRELARLEEIQQLYNSVVKCPVQGKQVTLAICVKLVGGAGRREKMWREAAVGKQDRFSYREDKRERSKDTEYATRTLSAKDCSERAKTAMSYASAIRNAISRGNSVDVECEKLGISDDEFKLLFIE